MPDFDMDPEDIVGVTEMANMGMTIDPFLIDVISVAENLDIRVIALNISVSDSIQVQTAVAAYIPINIEYLYGASVGAGWTDGANAIDKIFNNVYGSFASSNNNRGYASTDNTVETVMTFISKVVYQARWYSLSPLTDDSVLFQVDTGVFTTYETFNSGNQPPASVTTKEYDVTVDINTITKINGCAGSRWNMTMVGGSDTTYFIDEGRLVLYKLYPLLIEMISVTDIITMVMYSAVNVFDSVTVTENVTLDVAYPIDVFDTITITEVVSSYIDVLNVDTFSDIEIFESIGIIDFPLYVGPMIEIVTITEVVTLSPDVLNINVSNDIAIAEPTSLSPDPLQASAIDLVTITENLVAAYELAIDAVENITITEVFDTLGTSSISRFDSIHIDEDVTVRANFSFVATEDIFVTDVIVAAVIPILPFSLYEYIIMTESVTNALDELFVGVQIDSISINEIALVGDAKPVVGPVVDTIVVVDTVTGMHIDALFLANVIETITITEVVTIAPDPLHISLVDNITVADVLAEQETIDIFLTEDITVTEDLAIENPLVYISVQEIISIIEVLLPDLQSMFNVIDTIAIAEATSTSPDPLNLFLAESIVIDENLVDQEVMELLIFETISVNEDIGLPELQIGINEFEDIQFDDVIVSGPLIETLSLLVDLTPVSRVRRVIDLIRNS